MKPDKSDHRYFEEIALIIQESKRSALRSLNKALIELYWCIGEYLSEKVNSAGWGKGVVEELSEYLGKKHPGQKGFGA